MMSTTTTVRPRRSGAASRPPWVDDNAPAAGSKTVHPRPLPAAPRVPAAVPGQLHDPVTAVHDSIDFARALVADGGTSTAGLTMLRGELQQVAREVRAMRQEYAALRADVERVRLDLVNLSQFTHGLLVDRLATRFRSIDARMQGLAAAVAAVDGPGFTRER